MGFRGLAAAVFSIAALTAPTQAADSFRLLVLDGSFVKWGEPELGTGASVTYAFLARKTTYAGARNCAEMEPFAEMVAASGQAEAALRREAAAAFRVWERNAPLSFMRIADPDRADIVIGAEAMPRGRAFTNVALAEVAAPGARRAIAGIRQGLICLNPFERWKVGFDGNLDVYDLRYTFTHEIGHAIGLDHPGPQGALMGYRYDEQTQGLQPGDIAAVQTLYGVPQGVAPATDMTQ